MEHPIYYIAYKELLTLQHSKKTGITWNISFIGVYRVNRMSRDSKLSVDVGEGIF